MRLTGHNEFLHTCIRKYWLFVGGNIIFGQLGVLLFEIRTLVFVQGLRHQEREQSMQ